MRGIGIALALLLAPAVAGTWNGQTIQGGSTPELRAVHFTTPSQGLAVGAGGAILRTLDGGATPWTVQTTGGDTLNGVGHASAAVACAVGDNGTLIRTTNADNAGGSTWTNAVPALAAVAANSVDNVWAAGSLALRRSTNHGVDWAIGDPGSPSIAVRGMSFLAAATEGYWVGDMGTVLQTTDGASWAPVPGALGTTNTLNAVSMVKTGSIGAATGWVVGNGGVIRKTTDSGSSAWTTVTVMPAVSDDLNGVFAGDGNHAWAVGANGKVVGINGGANWTTQFTAAGNPVMKGVSMVFDAGQWKGVAVGANSTVLRTVNGGLAWSPATFGVAGVQINGVAMLSANDAVAVGNGGVLRRSDTGGQTWAASVAGVTTTEDLLSVSFASATVGWAVGNRGTVLYTSDGGQNWQTQMGGASVSLKDVKFGDANAGLAVGATATVLRTLNGGVQWLPLTNTGAAWAGRDINGIAFGSAGRAVAVGANGGVLATNDAGGTWVTVPSGSTAPLIGVSALSPTAYVAVGGGAGGAAVTITCDSAGTTWSATPATTAPSSGMRSVTFAPYSRLGYAVGDGGAVYVSADAGDTWTSESAGTTSNLLGAWFPYTGKGWAVGAGGTIRIREIDAPPLLVFPPHYGTPYNYEPPVVDGFLDPELTEPRRPDTGWDLSLQVQYGDGTVQPPCTFRGLRHRSDKYLYLSFDVRYDTAFDATDAIVLLFRPTTTGGDHTADDRKIVIYPLTSTTTGTTAGSVVALPPNTSSYPSANAENGDPAPIEYYRWTGSWTQFTPATATNVTCKVRAWEPTSGNKCWSVEMKIPTDTSTFTEWITLPTGSNFLFSYYLLKKLGSTGVVEYSWPRDLAISGPADIAQAVLPAYEWGTAKLGNAGDGPGVHIQEPTYNNIGVTVPPTGSTLLRKINGTETNTFHVWVANNSGVQADNVRPTFYIADWGVNGGDVSTGAWRKVHLLPNVSGQPAAQTIPGNTGTTPNEYTFTWALDTNQRNDYMDPHDHQCIMVTLDSTSNVVFSQRAAWTNMDYVPASTFGRKATVSAKGFGAEGSQNGAQRFYLNTTAERFDYAPGQIVLETTAPPPPPGPQDLRSDKKGDHPYYSAENQQRLRLLKHFRGLKDEKTAVSHYTWSIHAVRETTRTVKIKGNVYPICEPMNGFGYVARHGDAVKDWSSSLSGAVVTKLNDFEYRVDVPVNRSVVVDSGLEAREGGGPPLWLLVLLLFLFLVIIFWFLKKNP